MTPEEAFLEDIREHPDDDTPRLIFADWLEDHGDSDRAEFIRSQIRIDREGYYAQERSLLIRQVETLLEANWQRWVGQLHALALQGPLVYSWESLGYVSGAAMTRFRRGFVEQVEARTSIFARVADDLLRQYPIRRLGLHEAGAAADALTECEQLAWIKHLEFIDYHRSPLDARGMGRLATCPYLRRLSHLYLSRNHLGDEGVAALSFAPWLPGVRQLNLSDNGLSYHGVEALATTPRHFRPRILQLDDNILASEGLQVLLESPILAEVEALGLRRCRLTDRAIVTLAQAPCLHALTNLDLSDNLFGDAGRRAIEEAPWRRQLRQLRL